jgi:dinuclear metal center YbgI/SA1388 family protein
MLRVAQGGKRRLPVGCAFFAGRYGEAQKLQGFAGRRQVGVTQVVIAMTVTVGDIVRLMENLAPASLAEHWDNVGLQVGRSDWRVETVWVALDPLPAVIEAACRQNVDMLITHHPLLFKPLKRLDFAETTGRSVLLAAQNQLAVLAAHTNFDSMAGGLNDIVADRLGLTNRSPLLSTDRDDIYKLVVFVPTENEQQVLSALFETAAGRIGAYSSCSFRTPGRGTFDPGQEAAPFLGERGRINDVAEVRVETVVRRDDIATVVAHLRSHHPYETMAYDLYPLRQPELLAGVGRIGELAASTDLKSLALEVKRVFAIQSLRVVGDAHLGVKTVAVCTGSGSGLMPNFLRSAADVFISGDLRYHDARDTEAVHRGLIDVGHFASEHIMVAVLTERLREAASTAGLKITVQACALEHDPFYLL